MVTEKEIEVYRKLFDVAADNMESAGLEMEIDRDAFLAVVHMHPHKADMLRLSNLSKRGFVQAAFASMLHRYPEEGSVRAWKDKEDMEDLSFRRKLIETLRNSEEGKMKQVSIQHNIYSDGETEKVQTMVVTGYGKLDRLYEIYGKMPGFMKRLAKKIMR